jgi:hypothetical protein
MIDRAAFPVPRRKHAVSFIPVCFVAASFSIILLLLAAGGGAVAQQSPRRACAGDNGGITLSPGFCATVFADNLGHARQMAFAPNGVLYVNTWIGRYYKNDKPPAGGFSSRSRTTKATAAPT